MAIDPSEMNFNIMALTGGQALFWTGCAIKSIGHVYIDYLAFKQQKRSVLSQTNKRVWYLK